MTMTVLLNQTSKEKDRVVGKANNIGGLNQPRALKSKKILSVANTFISIGEIALIVTRHIASYTDAILASIKDALSSKR